MIQLRTKTAEAAASIERYFTVALPLHAQDEDLSLLPRLRAAGPARVVLLAETPAAEHQNIHATVRRLAPLWHGIALADRQAIVGELRARRARGQGPR